MKKNNYWILIILISILSSCAYYNTFYNADLYFEKGIKDYKESLAKSNTNFSKKNFNLAIEKAEKVLANYPKSKWCDDAQYIVCVSNFYKGNYQKAKKEIEEFFEKYPGSELKNEMNMWQGRVYWKMESPEMAIHHWRQLLKKIKSRKVKVDILYSIGEVFVDISKPDSAIHYFHETTKVKGGSDKHGLAQFHIAELYLKQGKMDEAIEGIEKVGDFNIENELKQRKQVLLLKIYRKAKQFKKAEDLIFKKLGNEKNKKIWDELELELGLIYRDLGDTSAAIARLSGMTKKKEYAKSKSTAAAFYHLGLINLIDVHDYKKAQVNFEKVKRENSKSEYILDANQRIKQLKRYTKIQNELKKTETIVKQIIENLNNPVEEEVQIPDSTEDKSADGKKHKLENKEQITNLANVDTLSTFETYYKKRYELAELYYFDFNFKDSAKIILDDIVHAQYFNPFVEQSLYGLYYINKKENKQEQAEFYLGELRETNEISPFITFIDSGKVIMPEKFVYERSLFEEAEALSKDNPDSALIIFNQVLDSCEVNPYQGRSAMNIAWIMENTKYDLDKSINWYKVVLDSFPNDENVQLARQRFNVLNSLKASISDTSKADIVPDSNLVNVSIDSSSTNARLTIKSDNDSLAMKVEKPIKIFSQNDSINSIRSDKEKLR